ncbi:MAG TPA: SOS response-associated peptidase [Nitrospiria bacterium]|nr:SOS response-associated peptidase [Nitrospiria bacterium]
MCGRDYSTYTEEELFIRYLNKRPVSFPKLTPNYNTAPTQNCLVLRVLEGERTFDCLRWGLIPFWAKDIKSTGRYSLINAKAEEITEKRSYKEAFEKRRCIVPVSGFFEWKKEGTKPKRPFCVRLKDEPIMSFAGIWERWHSKDEKEEVTSFAIITTDANEVIQEIHNRMPVILDRDHEPEWLNPENTNVKALKALLKPCPPEWIDAYEISTLVNSPRNNRAEVLSPV